MDARATWQPDDAFFDLIRDRATVNAIVSDVAGEAVAKAKQFMDDHDIEVWCRNRFVRRLVRPPPFASSDNDATLMDSCAVVRATALRPPSV